MGCTGQQGSNECLRVFLAAWGLMFFDLPPLSSSFDPVPGNKSPLFEDRMDASDNTSENNNVEKMESSEDLDADSEPSVVKIPPPLSEKLEIRPNGINEDGKPEICSTVPSPLTRSIFPVAVSPAAERIRFILGEDDDSPAPPQLFTELDELLSVDGQEMEWKETAR